MKSQLRVPAGNLMVNDVNWYSDVLSNLPYPLSIRLCLRNTLEFVLSLLGSILKAFVTAPSHSATLPPWVLSEKNYMFLLLTLFFVCVYIKYHMKYWKTVIDNIMSCFVLGFFASIMVTLAICVCYLYIDLLPSPIPDAVT